MAKKIPIENIIADMKEAQRASAAGATPAVETPPTPAIETPGLSKTAKAKGALSRRGQGLTGKIVSRVTLPTLTAQAIEQPLLAVDQALVGRRQLVDTQRAAAAEQVASQKLRQVREQFGALTPEQQKIYTKEFNALLAAMPNKNAADSLFQANQRAYVAQVVLERVLGKGTAALVQGLKMMGSPDAVSRFGLASLNSDAADYRSGTAMGRISGQLSGTLPENNMNAYEKTVSRIWRTVAHPLTTVSNLFMNEEAFPQTAEPAGAPQDVRSVVEGLTGSNAGPLAPTPASAPDKNVRVPEPKGLKSAAARTYEDFIQTALTKAGFGPETMAAAGAYKGTYAPIMGGNRPAFNPYLGGRVAMAGDAQAMHIGTQQQIAAARQAAIDRDDAVYARQERARAMGGLDYQKYQTGEALQAAALAKGAVSERDAFNGSVAMHRDRLKQLAAAKANAMKPGAAVTPGQLAELDNEEANTLESYASLLESANAG